MLIVAVRKGYCFLLGFFIGAASGALQFWLLTKYTKAVTGGNFGNKTVLFAIPQFLLPLLVLLGCALLMPESLLWTGAGMAGSLIIFALVRFLVSGKHE